MITGLTSAFHLAYSHSTVARLFTHSLGAMKKTYSRVAILITIVYATVQFTSIITNVAILLTSSALIITFQRTRVVLAFANVIDKPKT